VRVKILKRHIFGTYFYTLRVLLSLSGSLQPKEQNLAQLSLSGSALQLGAKIAARLLFSLLLATLLIKLLGARAVYKFKLRIWAPRR